MSKFKIPVEWMVCDFVEVEANNVEEAIQYVVDNANDIPLGTEPEYIDGTWRISADAYDGNGDVKAIKEELEQYYGTLEM